MPPLDQLPDGYHPGVGLVINVDVPTRREAQDGNSPEDRVRPGNGYGFLGNLFQPKWLLWALLFAGVLIAISPPGRVAAKAAGKAAAKSGAKAAARRVLN